MAAKSTAALLTGVPSIENPALPGSILEGSSQGFSWIDNGAPVVEWWLYVGTTEGGRQLHNSGSLGSNLETTVNRLPIDGSEVFVRLWYRTAAEGWQSLDEQYSAVMVGGPPSITSPSAFSALIAEKVLPRASGVLRSLSSASKAGAK